MNDDAFSDLMASTDPALIVLTTAAEAERAGCLVGFHSQSSISAQHYCVWLSKANHTYRVSLRATYFVAHFLTKNDLEIAELFGGRSGDDVSKFANVDVDHTEHGVPLLRACPNRILLRRSTVLDDGGDHVCVTAHVESAHAADAFTPLRVSDVKHLDPGHASEERAIRP